MRSDAARDDDGISIRRVLNAPCKRVFEAWTRPELMAQWFFAGEGWTTKVSADVRVGGRYELTMRNTSGEEYAQFGEYREIVPVTRLVFTWSFAPLAVVDSVVTVELVDLGATTELNLTHVLPPDPKIRRSHEDGWTGCLRNLDLFVDQEPQEPRKNEGRADMIAIKDEIRIAAPASKVYEALTRQAGYRGWWNAAGEVPEAVGGEANLHFVKEGKPVNMRFRIDEMKANDSVRWTCVANDGPSWVGTTLSWRLKDAGGSVLVSFEHDGWKEPPPEMIAQSWKHFLGSLKAYVETGTGQPW